MSQLTLLRTLDGPFRFLREPGPWLWIALAVGALWRLHLVLMTPGTLDVTVWAGHGREISERGLLAYYHGGQYIFNHPPLMGWGAAWLWRIAESSGLPFALLLRLPFALLDGVTALLLLRLLATSHSELLVRARYALTALYWVSPLAALFSAYHGNTDSAVACLAVAATLFATSGRAWQAGAMIGLGLWLKVPIVLAAPVLFMALPAWRERTRFVAAAGATALVTWAPVLLQDARVVIDSVIFYSGLRIQTTSGAPVWGLQGILQNVASAFPVSTETIRALLRFGYRYNTLICLLPIGLLAWSQRHERRPEAIAAAVGGSYAILYGLTSFWAFQYLAWSLPFACFFRFRFSLAAQALTTLYVYGLYAWLSGGVLLTGTWDFVGKPSWPALILLARDACVLLFFGKAIQLTSRALTRELRSWQAKSRVG
jgi:hypothetical protein